MANKTNTQAQANTQEVKSIIDVELNGFSALDMVADVKKRLEQVEKSIFNIALECAYATGVEVPAHIDTQGNEHGVAKCDAPIKQAKLVEMIGRSKQAISRWIKAVNLVIENGYFTLFYTGTLPFSYDKIILICENEEVFNDYVFADLMSLTVKQLEDKVAKSTKKEEESEQAEESEQEQGEQAEQEQEEEISDELAVLSYNGKEYKVNKAIFEKWLADNAITE